MSKDWIQGYTGTKITPLAPTMGMLYWADQAHALSNLCRYTGHVRKFYAVAEHAVWVSLVALERARAAKARNPKYFEAWGLIHDNSEAYLNDLARPVKHQPALELYRQAERELQRTIAIRYGLAVLEPQTVRDADNDMLATEAADLMSPLHPEWGETVPGMLHPAPFKVLALPPRRAEALYAWQAHLVFDVPLDEFLLTRWQKVTGFLDLLRVRRTVRKARRFWMPKCEGCDGSGLEVLGFDNIRHCGKCKGEGT